MQFVKFDGEHGAEEWSLPVTSVIASSIKDSRRHELLLAEGLWNYEIGFTVSVSRNVGYARRFIS